MVNDVQFANSLCNEELSAKKTFQDLYSDELFYIANKLCNLGIKEEYWTYRTKKGYSIKVTDEVTDAYKWLFDKAVRLSCKYKNKGTFEGFIVKSLASNFTRLDWIKKVTKVTGYVPKNIEKMGKLYVKIFTSLRQKKDDNSIMIKYNLDEYEYFDIKNDIIKELVKKDQLDFIQDYKITSLTIESEDGEVTFDHPDKSQLSVENLDTLSIEMMKIQDIIDTFDSSTKMIASAYWGKGLSAEKLFSILNDDFSQILLDKKIKSSKDVYTFINTFIDKFYESFKKINDKINKKGARTIIENYFLLKK